MVNIGDKRVGSEADTKVQSGNQTWWTNQTMSYDWKDKITHERFSLPWFDDVDQRFVFGHRYFAHGDKPFGNIIPYAEITGQRVLEIGCGMGLHTECLVRAGADVTSIDLSPTSVEATRRRLALKGLKANVQQMDAQTLAFPDASFDFVWSWGVIHHSAMTGVIVRHIHRVLKPGGETRVMVYNMEGTFAYVTMMRRYMLGYWRGKSFDELLWKDTDGYTARYYTKDQLKDLFRIFFADVGVVSFGQDADAVPLPSQLRKPVLALLGDTRAAKLANARGSFLFVTAVKDESGAAEVQAAL